MAVRIELPLTEMGRPPVGYANERRWGTLHMVRQTCESK